MRTKSITARLGLAGTLAATAFAHYTWVSPVGILEAGKTAIIRISHGDIFPHGDEAINASQAEVFVVAPSGGRVKLQPTAAGATVTAPYAVRETGLHRIVLTQDRGVTSRTPKGVRPGGRDKNPDATQASRTFRSAVAYAATPKVPVAGGKPVGLEFELSGEVVGGAWRLQLIKLGKPAPGVDVAVFLAGAGKPMAIGKTGPGGHLVWPPPMNAVGPAMFFVELRDPAPAGAPYDAVNYSTSLYVSW